MTDNTDAMQPLPTEDQCDQLVAKVMDKIAAKASDQYGTVHALDLNPSITEHHTLRRGVVQAAYMLGATEALAAQRGAQVEEARLRAALEKIADWQGAWGPYPENNEAWRAMAIMTAREAVPMASPQAPAQPANCQACGYELTASPQRAVEPPEPEFLNEQDKADLLRIEECFSDNEGYDLPRERMQRLAELGVIRHNGGGVYSITAFGMYCTGAWPVLPLKTAAESNAEAARLHAERMERGITKEQP